MQTKIEVLNTVGVWNEAEQPEQMFYNDRIHFGVILSWSFRH